MMAVGICQFLIFSLDLCISYTLGGATKSEVTSLEQHCNQVSDAPKSTGRVDCGVVVNNRLQTLLHNRSSFCPIAYWSPRCSCLGFVSVCCEPHRDRWLVPPPRPGPQRTGALQILAELANERGRERGNEWTTHACLSPGGLPGAGAFLPMYLSTRCLPACSPKGRCHSLCWSEDF